MAISSNKNNREFDSYEENASDAGTDRRVAIKNTVVVIPSLRTSGRVSVVTLNASTWVALPVTALAGRNALSIQNFSGTDIKINYDNSVVGYVGMTIENGVERFYDITDSIIIYAKASSGTPDINVEELS